MIFVIVWCKGEKLKRRLNCVGQCWHFYFGCSQVKEQHACKIRHDLSKIVDNTPGEESEMTRMELENLWFRSCGLIHNYSTTVWAQRWIKLIYTVTKNKLNLLLCAVASGPSVAGHVLIVPYCFYYFDSVQSVMTAFMKIFDLFLGQYVEFYECFYAEIRLIFGTVCWVLWVFLCRDSTYFWDGVYL